MVRSAPVATPPLTAISTPCIRLCAVDGDSGLCRGCGRTLAEIASWSGLSEEERRAIIARLPERRVKAGHMLSDEEMQGSESRESE